MTTAVSSPRTVPPAPPYGLRARVAERMLRPVLRRVPVRVRVGRHQEYGEPTAPALDVVEPASFFARLGHSPMIGFGESYMAGEWRPHHPADLADVLAPFAARLNDLTPRRLHLLRRLVLPRAIRAEDNTRSGARHNIHRHYDLSNEMFEQFLDPSLSYSCALFPRLDPPPTAADLEAAQLRKVDAILDTARVGPRSRLLEIGTGWGTLAIRAAQRGAHVTTLTISRQQAELAQRRVDAAGVDDRVEIALRDYRDQGGRFDAVVSVEMVEAVGERYWPTYFRSIDERLVPGGRAAIQAILLDHDRMLATRNTYTWIQKYIFPGGMLPSLEAIQSTLAAHTSLRLLGTRRMGQHYAHTLRLWRERFTGNWPAVASLGFDETFRRMWEYYLASCEAGFRTGYLDVAQLELARPR